MKKPTKNTTEPRQFTPFDWLKQITVEKREWDSFTEDEQNGFNAFIINKALSFNKDYIQVVEMAMTYPMPPNKLYDFYKDIIPKKSLWNKWIKSQVNFDEQELQFIAEYFECSTREAKDFIDLLEDQEKDLILLTVKGFDDKPKKIKKEK
jgi:hypothetical protein